MSDEPIQLAINGAGGRMGQRLIALAEADDAFMVTCAVEAEGHPWVGKTMRGVAYTDRLTRGVDVAVDFSLPEGTRRILAAAVNDKTAMVIGTTGFTAELQDWIDQAAREIPIVQAPNFSVGVNVLLRLVASAAQTLGDAYDVEIRDRRGPSSVQAGRSLRHRVGPGAEHL